MENKKKSILAGTFVAGALITAASFSAQATAFHYNDLGNGAAVRSNLLESNTTAARALELKCGADSTKAKDGKCGAKKGKSKDAKCGEGKCGDKKKGTKTDKKDGQ